jgi:phosphoenolpyruvate carboxykinase (ATP)
MFSAEATRQQVGDALKPSVPKEEPGEYWKSHHYLSDVDKSRILRDVGIKTETIFHNVSVGTLYNESLKHEKGSVILSSGALGAYSGKKTGRSPTDKRVVDEPSSTGDVWWGTVNVKLSQETFDINRERAIDYLNTREQLYVFDGFAGWDPAHRYKIRVITSRAYHALFMHNLLIRPSEAELRDFGEPDFTIYNAGCFPANRATKGMTSATSVALNFASGEVVILGTEYAGEMKKGVFTIMNYLLPKRGILSMHASANEGKHGDVSVFFGLSGTGKTTLSADPERALIGDDEHAWTDSGIFNIEGGCYAKAIGLTREQEPEIYDAIRFGAILENVGYDERTRHVDYNDTSITENTRLAYPLEFIPNAKIPAVGGHPTNIVMLTCDAFGVLPPVSKLTSAQAMYHFISGYTAKVAGTEMGVTEPSATFSACFGAPFMVWHPAKYAELLAEKLAKHDADAWLINTGWTGGGFGQGKRMSLKDTRAIIDAIHSGDLAKATYETFPRFNLRVPVACPGVSTNDILMPQKAWASATEFEAASQKLATLFKENFKKFEEGCSDDIRAASPE